MRGYKKLVEEEVKVSTCCTYDVIYLGFVGLIDYGYKCALCDRKCKTKTIIKKILKYT